ncbi:MAG: asparaginase [Gemmatimonadota bacterium]
MNVVDVVRGGVVESRHEVSAVVADDTGRVIASIGEPRALTFYRSAAKPMQALPLVEDGVVARFGLDESELALCCASHEGEARHVEGARSILAKAGVSEDRLACGAHPPYSASAAAALVAEGRSPGRIHNNCSGKHAGMLAMAQMHGWPLDGYHEIDHPLQQRVWDEMSRWTELTRAEIPVAVDGCGVPCFAAPLDTIAASFARFSAAAFRDEPAGQIVRAMTAHAFMVGGTARACTDVMDRAAGRAFVKLGAEGVYGGGIPSESIGFALKVPDGGRRAVEVALVHLLRAIGVFGDDDMASLEGHANPPVMNTRGEVVGELRARLDLTAIVEA